MALTYKSLLDSGFFDAGHNIAHIRGSEELYPLIVIQAPKVISIYAHALGKRNGRAFVALESGSHFGFQNLSGTCSYLKDIL